MYKLIARGLIGLVLTGVVSVSQAADLSVGDVAPGFELKGSDGKAYKLSDFKGKKTVVVAWFPKAFTGGCTKECISFRANGEAIREYNVAYFTASCDTVEDNTAFAKQVEADYPILSDPDHKVANAYGLIAEGRKNASRWTYVIGEDGKIKHIDKNVKAADHGKDIVARLAELKVPKLAK